MPTLIAQPAMFVAGLSSFRRRQEEGTDFQAFAGHSLGEYAALVAGGSFSFEQGIEAVKVRAESMQAAAQASSGGMVAILGLDIEHVSQIGGVDGDQRSQRQRSRTGGAIRLRRGPCRRRDDGS